LLLLAVKILVVSQVPLPLRNLPQALLSGRLSLAPALLCLLDTVLQRFLKVFVFDTLCRHMLATVKTVKGLFLITLIIKGRLGVGHFEMLFLLVHIWVCQLFRDVDAHFRVTKPRLDQRQLCVDHLHLLVVLRRHYRRFHAFESAVFLHLLVGDGLMKVNYALGSHRLLHLVFYFNRMVITHLVRLRLGHRALPNHLSISR